jgi:chemotaxis protein histidine kinase CheA
VSDPLREVLLLFASEVSEQSAVIGESLVKLEQSTQTTERKDQLNQVARYAHTIKGNAGALGLNELEELAHAFESALAPYRSGELAVPRLLVQQLLSALDHAQAYIDATVDGDMSARPPLGPLAQALSQHVIGKTEAPAAARSKAEPLPPMPPPPPDPISNPDLPALNVPASEPVGGLQRRGDDTVRVLSARLEELDRQLDDAREVRVALENRADEARRALQLLDGPAGIRLSSVDHEFATALRERLHGLQRGLSGDVAELAARLGAAEDGLRTLRTVPVDSLVASLRRGLWEHAQSVGKRAELAVSGTDLALDRRLLEALKTSLLHLVRNALDHGIESVEGRRAAKKDPVGRLSLAVEQRGARAQITLSDDGRGIDFKAVRVHAVKRGLLNPAQAERLPDEAAMELIFEPGFSTASTVSRTSGRGVGLDVVRESVGALDGTVSVSSSMGVGTIFTLSLPLSITAAQALLVRVHRHLLAIPLNAVVFARHLPAKAPVPDTLEVEGQPLQVHSLSALLSLDGAATRTPGCPIIVLRHRDRLMAACVDQLLGERDVVVRAIPPELAKLPALAGAAALGDGKLAFLLSARALVDRTGTVVRPGKAQEWVKRRVVVCDDSITTRTLHRQVLEAAGYEVETAADGEEGFRLLKIKRADLLVSDVRMPRLDGLSLVRRMRSEPDLKALPAVLVSSLDSPEDRRRAEEAGATAFLPKGHYERGELLSIVKRLLADKRSS